jgi:hypothetical protein
MEGHPAHAVLPLNAKNEAFEALSWAWTGKIFHPTFTASLETSADRLLPSNQVVPAPFSQDECQELNSLLRSFNADQDGIQTRLVARILIRIGELELLSILSSSLNFTQSDMATSILPS